MDKRKKPECRYGTNCFRLNPTHFEEYSHKHRRFYQKKRRFAIKFNKIFIF